MVLVLGAGVLATLWLTLAAVAEAPAGARPDLGAARRALWATAAASALVYALYLVFGEAWLPYA